MADKKNASIQEILAAARKADGGGDAPTASSSAAESDQPQSSGPDATESKTTVTDQSAQQKPTKQMSVAEMLAAARGEKSGTSKPADAAPASPSESPAAAQKPSGDPK